MIFDGKKFAQEKSAKLLELPEEKRKKTLTVLVDPQNDSGMKYVEIKKKMADQLGVVMHIFHTPEEFFADSADGQMIQLPFPNSKFLIDQIDLNKDVDGLKEDSTFISATVRAVMEILPPIKDTANIVVVGVWGEVGSRVANELGKKYTVEGMDKEDFNEKELLEADVIISATGQPGLIGVDMVKEGVVVIDVGYPAGDFDPKISDKAAFFTPVPGGVGPVTVVSLFENLLRI